jgi:threonine/homoserine/homoserine lactone efflux protein
MLAAVIFGAGFGFAAVVQPGPMQAFFLSRVAQVGWRRTLPACFAPIISDGPIAALVLTALRHVPPALARGLQATGGVVLIVLAVGIVQKLRGRQAASQEAGGSAPRSLSQAVMVNVANPGPYLGWSLVLGPEVMRLWPAHPASAIAVITGFYAVLTAGNALTIVAFGSLQAMGERSVRSLVPISAAVLAGLGVYRIITSIIG